ALQDALRYPDRPWHLVLLESAGDSRWSQQHAADLLAKRGYRPEKVELVRRWFNGELTPNEWWPIFLRISGAYSHDASPWPVRRELLRGGGRFKPRPEALIFAGLRLLQGWTASGRPRGILGPTLVVAG